MMNGLVAKRYAKALFEVAQENHLLEVVANDLKSIIDIMNTTEGFLTFLNHPNIDKDAKKETVEKAFTDQVSWVSMNFILLLLESNREDALQEIYQEYLKLSNEAKGVAAITAVTAIPLAEQEQNQLATLYQHKLQKAIQLKNIVDPSIIGGMIVRVGDRIYDGSVKRKLELVNKSLMASQV